MPLFLSRCSHLQGAHICKGQESSTANSPPGHFGNPSWGHHRAGHDVALHQVSLLPKQFSESLEEISEQLDTVQDQLDPLASVVLQSKVFKTYSLLQMTKSAPHFRSNVVFIL